MNVLQVAAPSLPGDETKARTDKWLLDNRAAMDAWNAHVQEHGLPLAQFRQF